MFSYAQRATAKDRMEEINERNIIIDNEDEKYDIMFALESEICYKNPDNFYKENKICYIPELNNKFYTREDIIKVCKGLKWLAEFVFETIDWQSPSTFLDELESNPEILGSKYNEVFN